MAFAYTPLTVDQLASPTIGNTGHFDHHEDLDSKIDAVNDHYNAQLQLLVAHINNLEDRIALLEGKVG